MSAYILDKAYAIDENGGVPAYTVVVPGEKTGDARIAGSYNPPVVLGVTVHSQTLQGANVAVRKAGIARVIAADSIPVGVPVIVTPGGKVARTSEGEISNVLGFSETAAEKPGDVLEVFLAMHQRIG